MRRVWLVSMMTLGLAACSGGDPAGDVNRDDLAQQLALPSAQLENDDAVERAVADASRPEGDRLLDQNRHPAEVLNFAGVRPGWRVADLTAGEGYYSRVLSTAVGEAGHVYAHNPVWVAEGFPDSNNVLAELADQRQNMTHIVVSIDQLDQSIEEPLDAVFMVLFYHDTTYRRSDRTPMNQAIYDALKPGGVYLVIDHHALPGTGAQEGNRTHRIEARFVRDEILAAGFELIDESDMLANPDDPRTISVFSDVIRRNTDRFVYLFRRPE